MPHQNPDEVYRSRISVNQSHVEILSRQDAKLSNARLVVFFLILAVPLSIRFGAGISLAWVVVPLTAFIALVIIHAKVARNLRDAHDTIRFYEDGLNRIHDNWMGKGDSGDHWKVEGHLYAHDLDLFGEASLFQLLNTTRTELGGSALATWLTKPADLETIMQRQQATDELRDKLDLRENIALAATEIQSNLHPLRLQRWAEAPLEQTSPATRNFVRVLALISVGSFIGMFFWGLEYGYIPFMFSFILNMIVLRIQAPRAIEITNRLGSAVRDLQLFVHLAEHFENESFNSDILKQRQQQLITGKQNASQAIRKLSQLLVWMELHKNQMFIPFAIMLLWILHFAQLIEDWRAAHGNDVVKWMDALGEIEALCALSTYAYEHPDDPFPEFIEDDSPSVIAQDMRHPLLPATSSVPNSVTLDKEQTLLIVSGSNMSGKSTYLRTIGINIILAMAGAPVRCKSLRLTPCIVGASIQVEDSIQSGVSHFYAEILRLKAITELCESPRPVVFLIDEILHGTNSHDRKIGAQAVVDELLDMHAVGLITTHDLALTKLESDHAARIENVHFQDSILEDQLAFDYKVHLGIVQKSNALKLMKSIGLKINRSESE